MAGPPQINEAPRLTSSFEIPWFRRNGFEFPSVPVRVEKPRQPVFFAAAEPLTLNRIASTSPTSRQSRERMRKNQKTPFMTVQIQ